MTRLQKMMFSLVLNKRILNTKMVNAIFYRSAHSTMINTLQLKFTKTTGSSTVMLDADDNTSRRRFPVYAAMVDLERAISDHKKREKSQK